MSKQQTLNIWITGGGSGIGEQLCRHYASGGHRVIISGRDEARLQAVAADYPDQVFALVFDVSDDESVEASSAALSQLCSHLDLVILNAGLCEYLRPPKLETDMFRRVMDANYIGMVNAIKTALPLLQNAPDRPHVAGICSLASYIAFPRAAAYGASKAAAVYLLDALRIDFSHLFDVTVVNPGFVTTPMTAQNDFPMPFLMSAERAAKLIARRLRRRPMRLNFPRRLSGLLILMRLLSPLWYRAQMKAARQRQAGRASR